MKKLAEEEINNNIALTDYVLAEIDDKIVRVPASHLMTDNTTQYYGIEVIKGQTSSVVTKIGDATMISEKPVHAATYPAVVNEAGSVVQELDKQNITLQTGGSPATIDGSIGDVVRVFPYFYFSFEDAGDRYRIKISPFNLPGFVKVDEFMVGIFMANIDAVTGKLHSKSSVTPTISKTRAEFRTAAALKGDGWCQVDLEVRNWLYWLFVIENGNLDSQAIIGEGATNANSTDWSNYNAYNPIWDNGEGNATEIITGEIPVSVDDFVNNDIVDESFVSNFDVAVALAHTVLVSGTVVVTTTDSVTTYTEGVDYTINYTSGTITVLSTGSMADATSYYIDYSYLTALSTNIATLWQIRDIYGHLYEFCDGLNNHNATVTGSRFFQCKDPANFADDTETNYELIGNAPEADGYISKFIPGSIMPIKDMPAGSSSQHCGDYYYSYFDNDPDVGWRVLLVSGSANDGSGCGLAIAYCVYGAGSAAANIGSRLCFKSKYA